VGEEGVQDVGGVLQAWTKAFTLQVTLCSPAYVPEADW
jgi:hypothetical protein